MKPAIAHHIKSHSGPFWVLSLMLVLAFLLGGGSRADIRSLIVLRPLSVLVLGYSLWGLTWTQVREHRFLFVMAAAMIGLVLFQLLPLPPAVWSMLPGRELIVEIDRAAGLGSIWRPISLVPPGTWNALFSLFLPFAALVLGVRLSRGERSSLLPLIIGLGLLSSLVAVAQLGSGADGPFYPYRVTNNGEAVGLFANRNHQAVLLSALFPMLAAYASADRVSWLDARTRAVGALAVGIFLIPLILVTGSRAGMIVSGISLLGVPLVYRFSASGKSRFNMMPHWVSWSAVASIVICLAVLTIFLGRAEAFTRFMHQSAANELRYQAWAPVLIMAWHYFPVGSGFGSFREVFQVGEPRELLATTEFYHAHNDWLEAVLTGGLPAVLLLGVAAGAFISRVISLLRSSRDRNSDYVLSFAGCWIVLLFAIASMSDYPLRVPSIDCVFVVAILWAASFQTSAYRPKIN